MNSKAYSARNVNLITLDSFLKDRQGQDLYIGGDVGKQQIKIVLNWATNDFERPWTVNNPQQIRLLIEQFKKLAVGRRLIVALEPSGTYGDVLRQACGDAQIIVHRVSPKAAHDYAEVFDGVPSQHDGKDAAVIAELARLGKSKPWPLLVPAETHQHIEYHVDRMDARRRLLQMWCGRIEARLARHWPELLPHLKTTSPTLLKLLMEYAGPAALGADPDAAEKLRRYSRNHLSAEKISQIIDQAKQSIGVRQTAIDQQRLRDYASEALDAKQQVKAAQKHLKKLSRDVKPIQAMTRAVGNATACVLFTYLGDPANYHCGAAYVKAMGLNLIERSSGMYQGRLKISKRGPSAVRYWLYLAALRLIKKNSPVRPWYLQKKHRDSDQAGKALVGIMRRLGLALWHTATLGEAFDAKRLFPGKGKRTQRRGGAERSVAEHNRSTSRESSSIRPATFHLCSWRAAMQRHSKLRGAWASIAGSNLPCSRFDDPRPKAQGTSGGQTDWSYPRRRVPDRDEPRGVEQTESAAPGKNAKTPPQATRAVPKPQPRCARPGLGHRTELWYWQSPSYSLLTWLEQNT